MCKGMQSNDIASGSGTEDLDDIGSMFETNPRNTPRGELCGR